MIIQNILFFKIQKLIFNSIQITSEMRKKFNDFEVI